MAVCETGVFQFIGPYEPKLRAHLGVGGVPRLLERDDRAERFAYTALGIAPDWVAAAVGDAIGLVW